MNKICLIILFMLTGSGLEPAYSQYISGKLTENATISVLTVSPADPLYTMFGHTAVRVQDSSKQIDLVFNYGSFDFDTPYFYLKFLYGNLDYSLSVEPFDQFKQSNVALGRAIVSQTLDLSPKQVSKLVKKLKKNRLPQNRSYRYRFFHQNCVTQVRDLLSGMIVRSPFEQTKAGRLSEPTYRQKLTPYLDQRPWVQLGVNLMLGAGADRPLTNREQSFLPNALFYSLENASGPTRGQLVKSGETITEAQITKQRSTLSPIIIFSIIFMTVLVFTILSLFKGWQGFWLDRILFGGVGLLGVIMAFGSLVSLHQPLHHNWNLLWSLPTHLLVAFGMQSLSQNRWGRLYFWATLTLNIIVVIAWSVIPQQLPLAVIPILASLILRSAFRIYMYAPQCSTARQNTMRYDNKPSQKLNPPPVKHNSYE